MNNLKWIRIFLCVLPLFVSIYATLTYNETNVQVLPDNLRELEHVIFDALQTTANFFANSEFADATLIAQGASIFIPAIPAIGQTAQLTFILRTLLADESDWKPTFVKTIANEIGREITLDNIRRIEATMEMIENKFHLMSENNTDMENRKTIASIIHSKIDKLLNFIGHKQSLFRKYPLLGAPPIAALAISIILFDPVAKILIPWEEGLSCKMSEILQVYRFLAVDARLKKLKTFCFASVRVATFIVQRRRRQQFRQFAALNAAVFDAMSMRYNQYGYNETTPAIIRCVKFGRTSMNNCGISPLHMIDGGNEYFATDVCIKDYALLIRHRVEEMFPVEILNRLCATASQPTGFGWLTIKLKYLEAYLTLDGSRCDTFNACDTYIKVFIDDKFQFNTPYETDNCCVDLDVTFTSGKITKKTLIKIEVWDSDHPDSDDLILTTEGNVDSFLTHGRRRGFIDYRNRPDNWNNFVETISYWEEAKNSQDNSINFIDTISFWQDEYK